MVGSPPEAENADDQQETDESGESSEDIGVSIEQVKTTILEEQLDEDEGSGKIALSDDEDEDDLVSQLGGAEDSSEDEESLVSQLGKYNDSISQGNEFITQLRTQRALGDSDDEDDPSIVADEAQEVDRQLHAEENDYEMRDQVQEEAEETEENEEGGEEEEEDEEMHAQSSASWDAELTQEMIEKYGVDESFVVYALIRTSGLWGLAERLLQVMVQYCPNGGHEEGKASDHQLFLRLSVIHTNLSKTHSKIKSIDRSAI